MLRTASELIAYAASGSPEQVVALVRQARGRMGVSLRNEVGQQLVIWNVTSQHGQLRENAAIQEVISDAVAQTLP